MISLISQKRLKVTKSQRKSEGIEVNESYMITKKMILINVFLTQQMMKG